MGGLMKFKTLLFFVAASLSPYGISEPLYVLISGYHSCNTPIANDPLVLSTSNNSAYSILRDAVLKAGHPFEYVEACVNGEIEPVQQDLMLRMSSSAKAASDNPIEEVAFQPPFRDAIVSLSKYVDDVAQQTKSDRIYVVGHSYGGWLAMKLALKLREGLSFLELITLDPISPLDCTPESFISSEDNRGCKEAPSDVASDERKNIRNRAGHWLHFYQSQFYILHSGPYAEASNTVANQKIRVPVVNPFMNDFHKEIGRDPALWKAIADQVVGYLLSIKD